MSEEPLNTAAEISTENTFESVEPLIAPQTTSVSNLGSQEDAPNQDTASNPASPNSPKEVRNIAETPNRSLTDDFKASNGVERNQSQEEGGMENEEQESDDSMEKLISIEEEEEEEREREELRSRIQSQMQEMQKRSAIRRSV